jgi:hypothetical protein
MNEYHTDKFYLIARNFSPHTWEEICRDAKEKCFNWWIDHQPSNRETIDMDFDEIIKYLYIEKIHFSVIHRRGYEEWNTDDSWYKWHLEIGFCTMARTNKLPTTDIDIKGDLYLWIKLDEKHIPYFIEKYNLEQLK